MFEYFKGKIEQANKEEYDRISDAKRSAEKRVKNSTNKMLSLWCPINNSNCRSHCIHFSKGYIFSYNWHQKEYTAISSTCKLWR